MPTSADTPRLSLVAATGNRHKIAEMTRILAPRGITLLTPDDCGGMIDIDENGDTFEQNAILKAMNFEEGATAKDRNAQIGGHQA